MGSHAPLPFDRPGRHLEYLRLPVTDGCDLRSTFCIPNGFRGFQELASWLRFEKIERLIVIRAQHDLRRIRLTDDEPPVRRTLPEVAGRLARIPGISDFSLSNNGTRLDSFAAPLRGAGVAHVDVSLRERRSLQQNIGLVAGTVRGCGLASFIQTPADRLSIGFIIPLSEHFCAACDRVRLTLAGRCTFALATARSWLSVHCGGQLQ